MELGFECAFNFVPNGEFSYEGVPDVCQYSMFPLLLYVLSIFGLQLTI